MIGQVCQGADQNSWSYQFLKISYQFAPKFLCNTVLSSPGQRTEGHQQEDIISLDLWEGSEYLPDGRSTLFPVSLDN